MRIDPAPKYADRAAYREKRTEQITKYAALIFVFVSTFFFFIKLLFL